MPFKSKKQRKKKYVEGGEYVIKKDSVTPETEPILEKINRTGKLTYQCGGKIPHYDSRKRRK